MKNVLLVTMLGFAAACAGTEEFGSVEQRAMVAPTEVAAQALDDTHVRVTWAEVPDAFKYYVFRAEGAGPMVYIETVVAPGTTSMSMGLTASTQYSFTVQAEQWETSESSSVASATTYAPGQNYVQPPANITAAGLDDSRIALTWDATANAAKYYVYQAQGLDPLVYVGTVTSPETTWIATGLPASTQYSFAVGTAMNDGFESIGYSTPVTASSLSPGETSVPAPSNVSAFPMSESRLRVTWDEVPGASKYYVFHAQGVDPLVYIGTVEGTTMYDAFNLASNTQYSFAIATGMPDGRDSNGYSTVSSATTFTPGITNVQTPSSVSSAAVTDSRIELSWSAVDGAAKYYVFQAQGSDPLVYMGTVLAPATSWTAANLAANTLYTFAIGTGMPDGLDSSNTSATTSATTYASGQNGVQVPASVTATAISSSRIELSWSAVDGAAKYYVFRAEGAGSFAYIGSVVAPATSLLSANLAASTQYSFAIATAMPDGTESNGMSSTATATTHADAAPPSTPADVTATAVSDSRVEVSWSAVPGAVVYYVMRSDAGGAFAYITSVVAPTTEFSSAGLAAETVYEFQIMAAMPDGTVSPASSSASATTHATPAE
jgi:hypothetical protein